MKLDADKYYTDPVLCKACIEIIKEVIGEENITEWVEPSAGCGTFSRQVKGCKAYDLYPQHHSIQQQNYLELKQEYKKGRIIFGNPPYGRTATLIKKFYDKAINEGDYVAFILPISFYENNDTLYRTELIYSKIIKRKYTNKILNTCFNIYKKNYSKDNYRESKEVELKGLKIISLKRSDKNIQKINFRYDYTIGTWGEGCIFKECKPYEYTSTISLQIDSKYKQKVIEVLKYLYFKNNIPLSKRTSSISAPSLTKQKLIKYLKQYLPELWPEKEK